MQRGTVCVGKILMYVVGCDRQTMNIFQQIYFFGFNLIVVLITVTQGCQ